MTFKFAKSFSSPVVEGFELTDTSLLGDCVVLLLKDKKEFTDLQKRQNFSNLQGLIIYKHHQLICTNIHSKLWEVSLPEALFPGALEFSKILLKSFFPHIEQQGLNKSPKISILGEVAAGISHEVNNPLTVINGLAHQITILSEQKRIDPNVLSEIAKKIITTSQKISNTMKALRSFSHDSSQDPFIYESVQSIIETTLSFCHERLKNHNIEFKISNVDPNLKVFCRPSEIIQVLLNLLNNSHNAIASLYNKWITLEVYDDEENVFISVLDSGTGFHREIKEIFSGGQKSSSNITSMGLNICQAIIENHKGSFEFDEQSLNTKFIISIPKKDNRRKSVA